MKPRNVVLVVVWLAYSWLLAALYTHIPANPDQSIFDYIGWVAAEGGTLYVDAGELNWPGKMVMHWAAYELFGSSLWSYRRFDYALLLVACAIWSPAACCSRSGDSRRCRGPRSSWCRSTSSST